MIIALAIIGGYLLGSIPFGLVLTRMAGLGDIRAIGSGNIGATNVLRTGNKGLALATLILDASKGAIAVGIALYFANFNIALIAGFAALVAASFASGYHLVGGGSESAPMRASSARPRTGIVREGLKADSAVLREKPEETAKVVAPLPSGVAVTVLSESGGFTQIRYERQGMSFEGWTPSANLTLR